MFFSLLVGLIFFNLSDPAIASQHLEIGIAAFSKDGQIPSSKEIKAFEKELGRRIDTINWFLGFNGDTQELPDFPFYRLKENVPSRIIPMLTWEPWGSFSKIISGQLDGYIKSYAKAMKSYGGTIRLRFGHEMIQDDNPAIGFKWYPWQDHPQDYKKAYLRVHSLFKAEGADNVQFVWAVNFEPVDNAIVSKYYPGPEVVDWIGIDGYNWSGQSFDGVFKRMYATITGHPEIYGNKPIMLSEIGVGKAAGYKNFNKADWIEDAFKKLKQDYPRIKSFYWFDVNKERDWRLDESAQSLRAFQRGLKEK